LLRSELPLLMMMLHLIRGRPLRHTSRLWQLLPLLALPASALGSSHRGLHASHEGDHDFLMVAVVVLAHRLVHASARMPLVVLVGIAAESEPESEPGCEAETQAASASACTPGPPVRGAQQNSHWDVQTT
jgi:hypothetical protein